MAAPAQPALWGAAYSVYVRVAMLALREKGVPYDHHDVDIFAADGPPASHLALHPFARIPAFRHGDFALYETSAITRYVDEAFGGPCLQPHEAQARARMNQIISVADSYLYRPLVWGIYVALDEAAKSGAAPDPAALDDAIGKSRHCLGALADLGTFTPWLLGERVTLADLHLAPMLAYGCVAPQGRALLAEQPHLQTWWERMQSLPSMRATRFAGESA